MAQDPGTQAPETVTATPDDQRAGHASVQQPSSASTPYYLLMQLPGEETTEFVLLRSFVPFSDNDSCKSCRRS